MSVNCFEQIDQFFYILIQMDCQNMLKLKEKKYDREKNFCE